MKKISVYLLSLLLLLTSCDTANTPASPSSQDTSVSIITSSQATSSIHTTPSQETEVVSADVSSNKEIPTIDRTFYQYNAVAPKWHTTEKSFANSNLIKKAISCVAENVTLVETGAFEKGFFYDFDRDGQEEAIIVIHASQGDKDWFDGDLHSVFIDHSGQAHFIVSGCHMDYDILQYKDFTHFAVKTGNQTAAGGSYFRIYSLSNLSLKEEFNGFWYDYFNNTFFTTGGPQGINTEFFFWDSAFEKYNLITPKSISWEQFIKETNFDKKIIRVYSDDGKPTLVSIEDIKKDYDIYSRNNTIEVTACGNAIYSLRVEFSTTDFINLSFFLSEDYTYYVYQTMFPYSTSSDPTPYTQNIDVKEAVETALPPQ